MKKIVPLLIGLLLGAAFLSGCSKGDEAFTEKSHTPDKDQITGVVIDVRDRQIEVTQSADNQIHIDYFENDKEYYDIFVSDEHVLTMTAASDKEWTDYIGGKSSADYRTINLQLPAELLSTVTLSTTNEDIILPELAVAGDLSLSSQGGNIKFAKINVGHNIYLSAKNGDISGTIVGSYEEYAISANYKKGESNLPPNKESGTKTLTASNNNGDIDVEFVSE